MRFIQDMRRNKVRNAYKLKAPSFKAERANVCQAQAL